MHADADTPDTPVDRPEFPGPVFPPAPVAPPAREWDAPAAAAPPGPDLLAAPSWQDIPQAPLTDPGTAASSGLFGRLLRRLRGDA